MTDREALDAFQWADHSERSQSFMRSILSRGLPFCEQYVRTGPSYTDATAWNITESKLEFLTYVVIRHLTGAVVIPELLAATGNRVGNARPIPVGNLRQAIHKVDSIRARLESLFKELDDVGMHLRDTLKGMEKE